MIELTKSGLKKDIESGLKRVEIAEKYGLPLTQMNKAIEMAGLKGVKPKNKPMFVFVDEIEDDAKEFVQFNTKYSTAHIPVQERPIEGDEVERTEEGFPVIESFN